MARVVTSYLTAELNTGINIERLEIKSLNTFSLKNLLIKDLAGDTLLSSGEMSVKIHKLFRNNNLLHIKEIDLTKADIRLRKYKDSQDLNLKFIIDYFNKKEIAEVDSIFQDSIKQENKLNLKLDRLFISDSRFIFNNENRIAKHSGVNFYDIDLNIYDLDISEIRIEKDTFFVDINNIAIKEKSGFVVDSLSCNFKISPDLLQAQNLLVLTPLNDLDLDFTFSYSSFKDFKEFIKKVNIQTEIRPSTINLTEVGFFAPIMFAMDNRIKVMGKISGTVDNFKAKDFKIACGQSTQFRGNVQMNGLPSVKETFSHFSIKDFTATVEDIRQIRLPTSDIYITLPEILTKFGKIKINGNFTGFYNDFVSYAYFETDIGQLDTDILLRVNENNIIEYTGKLAANDFNAGRLFEIEKYLKRLDLEADINGSGLTFENMMVNMEGMIDSLEFIDYVYNEINISGNLMDQKFSGYLDVIDDNVNFDFDGTIDYSQNIPRYNFISHIKDAKLHEINLTSYDSTMEVSTNVNINLIGDQLDNMQGILMLDNTVYSEKGAKYIMNDLTLSITRESTEYALIRLFSDIADASLEGKFLFRELPLSINRLFNQYIDTLIYEIEKPEVPLANQDFIFDIELKNTSSISELFIPELKVNEGTKISGGYNSNINNLFIDGQSSQIEYRGNILKNWFIEFYTADEDIVFSSGSEQLFFSDTLKIENLGVFCRTKQDSVNYTVIWSDNEQSGKNYGNINGYLTFFNDKNWKLKFNSADVMIQDSLWIINPENYIEADTNFYHFNELSFTNNKQSIKLDGKISRNLNDTLLLGFQRFDLSNFDMFMKSKGIDPDGIINGNLKIVDFYNSPSFLSNIEISDFYFNKEKLGEAILKTTWNPSDKVFNILGEIIYTGNVGKSKTFEMAGTYFPESVNENFDIDIKLNNYKLKTVEPFIRSFGSNIKGLASGNLKLSGSIEKPDLTGEINLMRSQIMIDYINVKYFLADKIYFDQNLIHFDDVTIYDSLNNRVTCSGSIKHDYLKDFNLDLNFDANNIVGLNTTRAQNDVFYGNALASGNIRIHGPLDNIIMDISINSENGTDIKIPVSYSVDVTENDYIIFKNEAKKDTSTQEDYDLDLKGVTANIDLNVNNDADIQLYLPYQMGNIRARGNGDIKMEITPSGKFSMDGEYVISKGYLFLTLKNIINRNFDIRRGGKVSWTGDPYNARIDVKAVYKIKTTLGEYGPEEDSATRVPVDCVIGLSNNLYNPEIRFSIEFPDLKDDQKQYIYARLDTNDQAIMSQQMISLLVLNSFSSSTGYTSSVNFNTFSLLTNQLNSWLSQISNDFDIGVNYRPGDEISSQEMEVALSTQLFDERVLIDGNVGVRGSEDAQKTNDLVGEVNVEVKITRDGRFRAKAFNKTNNNYLYRNYSPYTQGVGIFYTQDFYKFRDIFRKKNKKSERVKSTNEELKE